MWIIPQPRKNVWVTIAQALKQDHVCLSTAATDDPLLTCLVGIPFKPNKYPESLKTLHTEINSQKPHQTPLELSCSRSNIHSIKMPVTNPLILWRNWIKKLPLAKEEPQEFNILGSFFSPYCVQFEYQPQHKRELFVSVIQYKKEYIASNWCQAISHIKMASTENYHPLKLVKGTVLISSNQAWVGIPSCLLRGLCTLGKLLLFYPNKIQIMNWQNKRNVSVNQKQRVKDLDKDCDSKIFH